MGSACPAFRGGPRLSLQGRHCIPSHSQPGPGLCSVLQGCLTSCAATAAALCPREPRGHLNQHQLSRVTEPIDGKWGLPQGRYALLQARCQRRDRKSYLCYQRHCPGNLKRGCGNTISYIATTQEMLLENAQATQIQTQADLCETYYTEF